MLRPGMRTSSIFNSQHVATRCHRVAKHAICWVQMLRSFGWSLQMLGEQCWDVLRWDVAIVWPGFKLDHIRLKFCLISIKPWPNGVASRRKLKTWVYLRLRLARPCVHLRWLALTCDDLCSLWSRSDYLYATQSKFSPFGHPTQVIASWVASINRLLANYIQDMSALRCLFLRLTSTCEETCESVWPPNASLYTSSTCIHLRLLAGPFGQGLRKLKRLIPALIALCM